MKEINNIPLIISGFIVLIVGIIITLHATFNIIPENPSTENVLLWSIVVAFGIILILGALVSIDRSQK